MEASQLPSAGMASSAAWLERSYRVLAGGVSTNVRLADHPQPFIADRAEGAHIWDADGREYIDYVCGFGAILLGYAHPRINAAVREALERGQQFGATHITEIALAEALCAQVPSLEMVRFSNSGSEAVHAALRLARAVTGRPRIVKFEGHYHGWFDSVLVSTHPRAPAMPSGEAVRGVIESAGIPAEVLDGILVLPWNDVGTLRQVLAAHGQDVAAVIMEPIMCNNGCFEPEPGFLQAARDLCDAHGCLLIFDEVITGFRVGPAGAQGCYGVRPDLSIFGKALGSGLPISVIGGRRDLMEHFGSGTVNHSGTFNGNTVATAAALATLAIIREQGSALYERLAALGRHLMEGIRTLASEAGIAVHLQGPGPVFWMWVFPKGVPPGVAAHGRLRFLAEAAQADGAAYERFRLEMRRRGVRLMPGGRWYVSAAHTDQDIDRTLQAARESFAALRAASW